MSAFWQIDVAKTPTTCVVNAVCFDYLVYQFVWDNPYKIVCGEHSRGND
jgi:hypothetical protein